MLGQLSLLPRFDGVDHVLPELGVVLFVARLVRRRLPVLEKVVLGLVVMMTVAAAAAVQAATPVAGQPTQTTAAEPALGRRNRRRGEAQHRTCKDQDEDKT